MENSSLAYILKIEKKENYLCLTYMYADDFINKICLIINYTGLLYILISGNMILHYIASSVS